METMTKEQAIKFLNGKKTMVANEEESRLVQEKLFKIGFSWYDDGAKEVRLTDIPLLYFDGGDITCDTKGSYEHFDSSPNTFISPQGIVNIEIKEEPQFKFGQEVLVREKGGIWVPAHFAFINKSDTRYPYVIFGGDCFEQCIALKGNEHLMGTDEMP